MFGTGDDREALPFGAANESGLTDEGNRNHLGFLLGGGRSAERERAIVSPLWGDGGGGGVAADGAGGGALIGRGGRGGREGEGRTTDGRRRSSVGGARRGTSAPSPLSVLLCAADRFARPVCRSRECARAGGRARDIQFVSSSFSVAARRPSKETSTGL